MMLNFLFKLIELFPPFNLSFCDKYKRYKKRFGVKINYFYRMSIIEFLIGFFYISYGIYV